MIIKPKMLRDWAKSKGYPIAGNGQLWDMYCDENPGSLRVFESIGILGRGDKMIATTKDVRAWARKVGIPVGKRGALRVHVWEDYLEQHPEANN